MKESKKSIKSDLKRIDRLKDQAIDYSDSSELDDSFFKKATVELPVPKDSVTLRIDHRVLEWFKSQGKSYQTRINAVLKSYYKAHHTD
ncbi:MAG: BrnA antitoxin family protein [Pseudomonadota bacterium]